METNEKNNLTENTIVSFNINDAIKGIGIIIRYFRKKNAILSQFN